MFSRRVLAELLADPVFCRTSTEKSQNTSRKKDGVTEYQHGSDDETVHGV